MRAFVIPFSFERAGRLAQLHEWVVTVDHKRLGVMYVVAGLAFFLVAGLEASVIRWQLAAAGNTVVSPQVFNAWLLLETVRDWLG